MTCSENRPTSARLSLPRNIIRKIQRAVVEFDLLESGDRVLLGLSGGKDSTFLLYALSVLARHLPFQVELGGLTVDLGFKKAEETDFGPLETACETLQVPHRTIRAELGKEILENPVQNPCARCSYLRRAIIHNYARENGFNKVAFAHHLDDAVETFLMSQLYSGQVYTFLPKTFLDRTGVTVIRPLVYLRESEIGREAARLGIAPVASPCPLDGSTRRAEVKELIRNMKKDNPHVFYHLAAAMREGREIQLWPRELTKEEIRAKSRRFWYGQ
ncbi:MAG: tRNA 2-thiocytidine biosynthesis TtcA family protein [Peptococcaceae bacterium]|jgi:tRNA(Ile)-lysidine synthase TilS/MesJ|nr:tRNA 2-thiocytidine biosynthesis TtcA family protein [Peptococcaceae bacterium]MDH7524605.1 tRNA 2-thiocytidine biosynthesis TtcA family protein [Peptococcaceae bacterium]